MKRKLMQLAAVMMVAAMLAGMPVQAAAAGPVWEDPAPPSSQPVESEPPAGEEPPTQEPPAEEPGEEEPAQPPEEEAPGEAEPPAEEAPEEEPPLEETVEAMAGTYTVGTTKDLEAALKKMKYEGTLILSANILLENYIGVDPGKTLTIKGKGGKAYTLSASSKLGGMPMVATGYPNGDKAGGRLVLENVIFDATGRGESTAPILDNQGSTELRTGAVLRGNNRTTGNGGGVRNVGTLVMQAGAEISGNRAAYGGGVYKAHWNSHLQLNGGAITGNSALVGAEVYGVSGYGSTNLNGAVTIGTEGEDAGYYGPAFALEAGFDPENSFINVEALVDRFPGDTIATSNTGDYDEEGDEGGETVAGYDDLELAATAFTATGPFEVAPDEWGINLRGVAEEGSLQQRIYDGDATITSDDTFTLNAPLYISGPNGEGCEITLERLTLARGLDFTRGNLVQVPEDSELTLTGSSIAGGSIPALGSGLYNRGTVTMNLSATVVDNYSALERWDNPHGASVTGAGIHNAGDEAHLELYGAIVAGNAAVPNWGDFYVDSTRSGGGIYNSGAVGLFSGPNSIQHNLAHVYGQESPAPQDMVNHFQGDLCLAGQVFIGTEMGSGLKVHTSNNLGTGEDGYNVRVSLYALTPGSKIYLQTESYTSNDKAWFAYADFDAGDINTLAGYFESDHPQYTVAGEGNGLYLAKSTNNTQTLQDIIDEALYDSVVAGGLIVDVDLGGKTYFLDTSGKTFPPIDPDDDSEDDRDADPALLVDSYRAANGPGGAITLKNGTIKATPRARTNAIVVEADTTLTLENVYVDGMGGYRQALVLNHGALNITGNSALYGNNSGGYGGAVLNHGTLTMGGYAEIYGNTAQQGGAVLNHGSFTMGGDAKIHSNTAKRGGGVANLANQRDADPASFAMNGLSIIERNTAQLGGGVYNAAETANATVTLNLDGDAGIFSNTAQGSGRSFGGGIYNYQDISTDAPKALVVAKNGNIEANQGGLAGGGIYNLHGTVQLPADNGYGMYFSNNTASQGGGIASHSGRVEMAGGSIWGNNPNEATGQGGGIFAEPISAAAPVEVLISGGNIEDNRASSGGGVYVGNPLYAKKGAGHATLTITGGTICFNQAAYDGGGLMVSYATATISGDTLIKENNAAKNGGGLYNHQSQTTIDISHNGGGGIFANTADLGGGIFANTADLGGGVYNTGSLEIDRIGLVGNHARLGVDLYAAAGSSQTALGGIMWLGARSLLPAEPTGGLYLEQGGKAATLLLGGKPNAGSTRIAVEAPYGAKKGTVVAKGSGGTGGYTMAEDDFDVFVPVGAAKLAWDAKAKALKFDELKFTITYYSNRPDDPDNSKDPPVTNVETYASGAAVGVRLLTSVWPNSTPPAGYVFAGWAESPGTAVYGKLYQPGGTITVRENVSLYAVWKPLSYSISYDLGNATLTDIGRQVVLPGAPTSYTVGESIDIPAPVINALGQKLVSWKIPEFGVDANAANENGCYIDRYKASSNPGNITATAVWVDQTDPDPWVEVTSLEASLESLALPYHSYFSLEDNLGLTLTFNDGNTQPSNQGVVWVSGNANVAKVSGNDDLYTHDMGTTTLTAYAVDGGAKAQVSLQVSYPGMFAPQLSKRAMVLAVDANEELTLFNTGFDADGYVIEIWNKERTEETNDIVIKAGDVMGGLNRTLTLEGRNPGEVWLRAYWPAAPNYYTEVNVEVVPNVTPTAETVLANYHLKSTSVTLYKNHSHSPSLQLSRDKGANPGLAFGITGKNITFAPLTENTADVDAVALLNECVGVYSGGGDDLQFHIKSGADPEKVTKLKSRYKVKLSINLGSGVAAVIPETLTLNTSTKLPTLKLANINFNTFYTQRSQNIFFSSYGDYHNSGQLRLTQSSETNKKRNETLLAAGWLELEKYGTGDDERVTGVTLKDSAKHSGTLYLEAGIRDWANQLVWRPVTVKVASKSTAPNWKLNKKEVSLYPYASVTTGVELQLVPKSSKGEASPRATAVRIATTTDITTAKLDPAKFPIQDAYTVETGHMNIGGVIGNGADPHHLVLMPTGMAKSGTLLLAFEIGGNPNQVMCLPVKVKARSASSTIKLKATKATVSLNANVHEGDSIYGLIAPNIADVDLTRYQMKATVCDSKGNPITQDVPLAVDTSESAGYSITTNQHTRQNQSYKVKLSFAGLNSHLADPAKRDGVCTITVKTLKAGATIGAKLGGAKMNLNDYSPYAVMKLSLSNYNAGYDLDSVQLVIREKKTGKLAPQGTFETEVYSGEIYLYPAFGAELAPMDYTVEVVGGRLNNGDNMPLPKAATLKVTAPRPKVYLSSKTVTLYGNDAGSQEVFWVDTNAEKPLAATDGVTIKSPLNSGFEVVPADADGTSYYVRFTGTPNPAALKTKTLTMNVKLEGQANPVTTFKLKVAVKQFGARLTVSPASASLEVGGTLELTATRSPTSSRDPVESWTSSNDAVATVDTNGKVTGVANGTAFITATTRSGLKSSCYLQVGAQP